MAPGEVPVAALLRVQAFNCLAIGVLSDFGCHDFHGPVHQPGQTGRAELTGEADELLGDLFALLLVELAG